MLWEKFTVKKRKIITKKSGNKGVKLFNVFLFFLNLYLEKSTNTEANQWEDSQKMYFQCVGELLSVQNVTANLYCICLSILQIYT